MHDHALSLKFRYKEERKAFSPLEYISSLWFSLLFISIPVAYLYFVLPFNPKKLDIYDWSAIIFCLLLMPLFEALGLLPIYWVSLVFFPTLYLMALRLVYLKYDRLSLVFLGLVFFVPFYTVSVLFPDWTIHVTNRLVDMIRC